MIGLIFVPDVAYGSFQTDKMGRESIIGNYVPYDLTWYQDEIYYLTNSGTAETNLVQFAKGQNIVVHKNIQIDPFGVSEPQIVGIYNHKIYVKTQMSLSFNPNALSNQFELWSFDLTTGASNRESYQIYWDLNSVEFDRIRLDDMQIRDNYLYFTQKANNIDLNTISTKIYRVNLDEPMQFDSTNIESSSNSLNLIGSENGLYYIELTKSKEFLNLVKINQNLDFEKIEQVELAKFKIVPGSEDSYTILDDRGDVRLGMIDFEHSYLNSTITIRDFTHGTISTFTAGYQIGFFDYTKVGDNFAFVGTRVEEIGANSLTYLMFVSAQLRGQNYDFKDLHKQLFESDFPGIVANPIADGGKLAFVAYYYGSPVDLSIALYYTTKPYSQGVFMRNISPAVQFNAIAIILSVLYLIYRYYRYQKQAAPDDLEYPRANE